MQPETRTVWLHSVLVFFSGVIQNMLLCLVGGFAVNKLLQLKFSLTERLPAFIDVKCCSEEMP